MDEEVMTTEEGVTETEPADQPEVAEETETPEGDNETETAEPSTEEPESEPEPKQSAEENAKYASARREAERKAEERIAAIQRQYDQAAVELAGDYVNPVTGKKISGAADYFQSLKAQKMQEQGIDPEMFYQEVQKAVQSDPTVLQAAQMQQELKSQFASQYITDAVKAIHEIDPAVSSIDDLVKVDADHKLPKLLGAGIDAKTAYMAINGEKLRTEAKEAAKQKAINDARGKSHLQTTEGVTSNSDEVEIPKERLSGWRQMFPDATSKELKSKYNAFLKSQK